MRSPKKAVIKNPSQKYKNDILPQINADTQMKIKVRSLADVKSFEFICVYLRLQTVFETASK